MKTKKIVINTGGGNLLTPYWFALYMKTKGVYIYCYKRIKKNNNIEYIYIKNIKELNNEKDNYVNIRYLKDYYGDLLTDDMFKHLRRTRPIKVYMYDKLKNREDKNLIKIVKQIENSKAKILEIPENIKYTIEQYECANGEYIEEKHREWHWNEYNNKQEMKNS